MAKLSLLQGTTSKLLKVFIQDSSVTTGAGLTGLTSGSSGLTCYYILEGANATVAVSLSGGTLGTWSSGGFIVVDQTHCPGLYELGIPNAALTGAKSVVVYLQGATNMVPCVLEIELTAVDNQNATTYGMGAIPNATAGAAGGLFIAGTNAATTITSAGGNALTLSSTGTNGAGLAISGNGSGNGMLVTGGATGNGLSLVGGATSGAGFKAVGTAGNSAAMQLVGQGSADGLIATGGATGRGIHAVGGATSGAGFRAEGTASNSPGIHGVGVGTSPGLEADGGASGSGIAATGGATAGNGITATAGTGSAGNGIIGVHDGAGLDLSAAANNIGTGTPVTLAATQTFNNTGTWTGNLTGSVGSVTGAVGSVTGNVGGNVVGSVGSLTLTQAIGSAPWNTTTLGDTLKAAWSQGVGKWAVTGTTLNIYAPDGTTVLKAFTLDSSTAPTSRT